MTHDPQAKVTRRAALGAACAVTAALTTALFAAPRAALAQTPPARRDGKAAPVRHIKWQELVPAGWDPAKLLKDKFNDPGLAVLNDADPRVQAMMDELRAIWDTAPVNDALDGVQGRIPGYVVPLEDSRAGLKSFLLVPYYGACIHSPPPPANQIIHVVLTKPVKGFQTMDTVWVQGRLSAARSQSDMGVSGYRLDAIRVDPYERAGAERGR